jgi:hypothetical protein
MSAGMRRFPTSGTDDHRLGPYHARIQQRFQYKRPLRQPQAGSILDLLGDWPLYVAVEIGMALGLWAAITVPWCLQHKPRAPDGLPKNPRD